MYLFSMFGLVGLNDIIMIQLYLTEDWPERHQDITTLPDLRVDLRDIKIIQLYLTEG